MRQYSERCATRVVFGSCSQIILPPLRVFFLPRLSVWCSHASWWLENYNGKNKPDMLPVIGLCCVDACSSFADYLQMQLLLLTLLFLCLLLFPHLPSCFLTLLAAVLFPSFSLIVRFKRFSCCKTLISAFLWFCRSSAVLSLGLLAAESTYPLSPARISMCDIIMTSSTCAFVVFFLA